MKVLTIENRKVSVETDILCNKCGKTCMKENSVYGAVVSFSTGFFSTALPDGSTYSFDVCEECLAEFMKDFVIEPDMTGSW